MAEVMLREAKAVFIHGESKKCEGEGLVPEEGKDPMY